MITKIGNITRIPEKATFRVNECIIVRLEQLAPRAREGFHWLKEHTGIIDSPGSKCQTDQIARHIKSAQNTGVMLAAMLS
jgi:hypothetical protein